MRLTRSTIIAAASLVGVFAIVSEPAAQTAPPPDSAPAAASSVPARDPALGPVESRPFGPGLGVDIESDKPWVYAFVAQGVLDDRPAFPDPFVKVGRLPLSIELPPGTYTVLVEGESVPAATRVFKVDRTPVRVKVKGGSQGLRTTGTLLGALGGLALVAGILVEISGTKDQDSSKKQKIALPLIIGGGVGFAGGLTMFLVSGTSITDDGPAKPGEADHARETYRGITLTGAF